MFFAITSQVSTKPVSPKCAQLATRARASTFLGETAPPQTPTPQLTIHRFQRMRRGGASAGQPHNKLRIAHIALGRSGQLLFIGWLRRVQLKSGLLSYIIGNG